MSRALPEEDDGDLSASEIAALKLDADWVVLSLQYGVRRGNEYRGALRPCACFQYAQARALLVSHWEVCSDAT